MRPSASANSWSARARSPKRSAMLPASEIRLVAQGIQPRRVVQARVRRLRRLRPDARRALHLQLAQPRSRQRAPRPASASHGATRHDVPAAPIVDRDRRGVLGASARRRDASAQAGPAAQRPARPARRTPRTSRPSHARSSRRTLPAPPRPRRARADRSPRRPRAAATSAAPRPTSASNAPISTCLCERAQLDAVRIVRRLFAAAVCQVLLLEVVRTDPDQRMSGEFVQRHAVEVVASRCPARSAADCRWCCRRCSRP